jgi:spore coat protein U-like protein
MSKQWFTGLSWISALWAASGMAYGQSSASTQIPVTATVTQSCTISTVSALAFAAYDPIGLNATAALNSNGQISVACSKGAVGVTIAMNYGTNFTGTQRAMLGGSAKGKLNYNIFQPPSAAPGTACTFPGTTPWNDTGAGLLTLTASPAKTARLYNVCGTIPGGQDVAADTYTDIVGATLNF